MVDDDYGSKDMSDMEDSCTEIRKMDLDSYLRGIVHNLGSHLNDPQYRVRGKTYNMCKSILAASINCSGKILVLGVDRKHHENLYTLLVKIFDETNTKYIKVNPSELRTGECSIVFELSKNTHRSIGLRSDTQSFVDHYTEEQFVLDGLRKLRDALDILKKGH